MADALDLGSSGNPVQVQVLLPALKFTQIYQKNINKLLEGTFMKKILILVLIIAVSLSGLIACGEETADDVKDDAGKNTNEAAAAEAGDRTNPIKIGESFTTEYVRYKSSNEVIGYTIKLSELLRGEEAMQLALEKNEFNDRDFPEGRELILFKVDFVLNKYSSDKETDPSWLASGLYFDFYNGDYSSVSEIIGLAGLDSFYAELYEGAQTSGWLYTTVAPDDATPMVCHDERIWFALYN